MVGKTFTRLVFWSRLLFSSPVLFKEDKDQRTGERESGRPMVYYY